MNHHRMKYLWVEDGKTAKNYEENRNRLSSCHLHFGMRAAAEMKKQAAEQGGGKGMMGMVLPMYAVGIIIYLVYTMSKVFMKNRKPDEKLDYRPPYSNYQPQDFSFENQSRFKRDLDEDTEFLLSKKEKLEELEKLLSKAENKRMTDVEMRMLRERLAETESQMTRILKAMEHVQERVRDGLDAKVTESDAGNQSKVQSEQKDLKDEGLTNQKVQLSCDSSPDMESYEIIGGSMNNSNEGGQNVKRSKGHLEVQRDALCTDLNALDSESSGRESDDEESDDAFDEEVVGVSNLADPTNVLGVNASEVEVVGRLAEAFKLESNSDTPADDAAADDEEESEEAVEIIGTRGEDGSSSGLERPEGLRKRQTHEKTDSS